MDGPSVQWILLICLSLFLFLCNSVTVGLAIIVTGVSSQLPPPSTPESLPTLMELYILDKKTNSFFMADRIQLRTMQTGIGAYKLTPPFLASVLFHNITSLQWSSLRPWRPKQYRREDALPNLLISLLFFSMCIEPRVINIYSFLNFCTSTNFGVNIMSLKKVLWWHSQPLKSFLHYRKERR